MGLSPNRYNPCRGLGMQQDTVQRCEGGRRTRGDVRPKLPLVSVITAVFSGDLYVAGCLESVLQQDYPNIEHIVLDGDRPIIPWKYCDSMTKKSNIGPAILKIQRSA